jgi:hypothetical protein
MAPPLDTSQSSSFSKCSWRRHPRAIRSNLHTPRCAAAHLRHPFHFHHSFLLPSLPSPWRSSNNAQPCLLELPLLNHETLLLLLLVLLHCSSSSRSTLTTQCSKRKCAQQEHASVHPLRTAVYGTVAMHLGTTGSLFTSRLPAHLPTPAIQVCACCVRRNMAEAWQQDHSCNQQ